MSFVMTGELSQQLVKVSEGHNSFFKDWCLMNSQATFLFFNLFKLSELWPYYQKHVNQIILNHTTL